MDEAPAAAREACGATGMTGFICLLPVVDDEPSLRRRYGIHAMPATAHTVRAISLVGR